MDKKDFLKEYGEADEVSRSDFPPKFVFGVATSAYQVSCTSVLIDYIHLLQSMIWDLFPCTSYIGHRVLFCFVFSFCDQLVRGFEIGNTTRPKG